MIGSFARGSFHQAYCLCRLHVVDPVYDPVRERTAKHLLEALAEVLRHQGVHDGVQAGVGVRHQVRENADDVGCVVEREVAEQHAQDNQVMRQPT